MSAAVETIKSMSRVGRLPVTIPSGVEVKLNDRVLTAKGPKGSLSLEIHPFIHLTVEKESITVAFKAINKRLLAGANAKLYRSIAGTTRSNINNTIIGVTEGFQKKLLLVGVGYRAQSKGKVLGLSLGFSHPTDFSIPEGITVETPVPTEILVKGTSKELVGLVAANIRKLRSPEPYKGKGIRYADERIELKETKKK